MSNHKSYNDGWQDGYWSADSKYMWGYEDGRRDERERIKRAIDGSSPESETSTLGAMVGGSIILTICGWCFVGLILFLFWIGGESESWWFPWIWRIAFWGGIGFIVLMSIAGIVMAIVEECETKKPSEKPADIPKSLRIQTNIEENWKKKYPLGDVETIEEAEKVSDKNKHQ